MPSLRTRRIAVYTRNMPASWRTRSAQATLGFQLVHVCQQWQRFQSQPQPQPQQELNAHWQNTGFIGQNRSSDASWSLRLSLL